MSESQDAPIGGRLFHFPISFFSVVMGLAGFSIAWMKYQHVSQNHFGSLSLWMAYGVSAVFIALFIIYGAKAIRYPKQVLAELHHPIKINFFPTISVSFLLQAILYMEFYPQLSFYLWGVGALMHLGFSLYVINVWMHHKHYQIKHMNPAWLIPAVGNVLVPVAGVYHGFEHVSWFFFSVGMMFWLILMTIIFYRVLFHEALDKRLMPTLFILIAPPAVGFIAYVNLTGEIDPFARFLENAALFLTLLILLKGRRFFRQEFFLSWWAYSFPMAAISIASFLMAEKTQLIEYQYIGTFLLGVLSLIVLFLIPRTLKAVWHWEICKPE